MLEKIKKYLKNFFFILLIVVWFGLYIKSDYDWSKKIIESNSNSGWEVSRTKNNYIDPTRIWTIFKAPITSVDFINKNNFIYRKDDMIYAEIISFNYRNFSKTEKDITRALFDCKNKKVAFVENNEDTKIIWSDEVQSFLLMICDKSYEN